MSCITNQSSSWWCLVIVYHLLLTNAKSYAKEALPIVVAGRRSHYFDDLPTVPTTSPLSGCLTKREWRERLEKLSLTDHGNTIFPRFASPQAMQSLWDSVRPRSSFTCVHGADGRKGRVASTNLGQNWVLAESEQIAVDCTPNQVLQAYLTGTLQTKWNARQVQDCRFTLHHNVAEPWYRQDLWLHSQRVLGRSTGIIHYAQRIVLDTIGDSSYAARISLWNTQPSKHQKPFTRLHVSVHLTQVGRDVHIYAAGVFCVNRQVIPHLVVWDAAGLAGAMAGKGTLWLAAHFAKRHLQSRATKQVPVTE